MPDPFTVAGLALGGLGAVGKLIFGGGQRKQARKIHPVFNQYQTNPFAKQKLGISQQLFNGRMPGAASVEDNIGANQATTVSNINRGATDSSQALALAGEAAGLSNEAYADLGVKEAANKQSMLSNLNDAYGTLISEGDKEYNSMMQKYQMDVAQKQALLGGGESNFFGGIGDLASLGIYGGQLYGNNKKPK